jgi:DNA-binding CsgD family transcriptional regulator
MSPVSGAPDPIALVEAAYDDGPRDQWMRGLLERALPLVPGAKEPGCYELDMSDPFAPKLSTALVVGLPPDFAAQWLDALSRSAPGVHAKAYARKVGTLGDLTGGRVSNIGPVGALAEQYAKDAFYCAALDAEGRGLVLATLLSKPLHLSRGARARWSLLAAHVAAADRLRRKLPGEPRDECILSVDGRVEHAEGEATAAKARERLRAAVVARDRARTRRVRASPDEALGLWRGLVSGRWSLLDRFERGGRRYIVARRNEPNPQNPLALTLRERQVLGHLVQGDAKKVVGYALGIDISTVSNLSTNLLLKLGLRSVAELVHLIASARAASQVPSA